MRIDGVRRLSRRLVTLALVSLGACQSAGGSFLSASSLSGSFLSGSFLSRGSSPAGAPIAFESIEGPPQPIQAALADELASAATSRRIELAAADRPARYRVRGYLSTETGADGQTQLAFVWDVFDAEMRRAKRVTGSSPVRSSREPWSGLDKEALRKLAAQSVEEIAAFLSADKATSGQAPPRQDS